MKQRILLLLLLCSVIMLSCEENKEAPLLGLKDSVINVSDAGGIKTLTFLSNMDWAATSSEDWCIINPHRGDAAHKSISAVILENDTYENRSCSVAITVGGATEIITINQDANRPENSAIYDGNFTEGPALIINAGNYNIFFSERTSWTFREVSFNDKIVFSNTGYHQPVIGELNVPESADTHLGTGHRKEEVESISLFVYEKGVEIGQYPVEEGLNVDRGDRFVVHKHSLFRSEFNGLFYKHHAQISISASGIEEDYTFEVVGDDLSNVNYMYVFMHMFPQTASSWVVGDDEKITNRGTFLDDNSFTLKEDIRFCMSFDLKQNLGVAVLYPEVYEGQGLKNSFWNRPRDNKHYLQIDPSRSKGQVFSYSSTIKAFNLETNDWVKEGKAIIEYLLGYSILF